MYDVLLVEEAHDCEELDCELPNVREGACPSDVPLIVVRIQRRGAEALEHQTVVGPVQELGLQRWVRGPYRIGSAGTWANGADTETGSAGTTIKNYLNTKLTAQIINIIN